MHYPSNSMYPPMQPYNSGHFPSSLPHPSSLRETSTTECGRSVPPPLGAGGGCHTASIHIRSTNRFVLSVPPPPPDNAWINNTSMPQGLFSQPPPPPPTTNSPYFPNFPPSQHQQHQPFPSRPNPLSNGSASSSSMLPHPYRFDMAGMVPPGSMLHPYTLNYGTNPSLPPQPPATPYHQYNFASNGNSYGLPSNGPSAQHNVMGYKSFNNVPFTFNSSPTGEVAIKTDTSILRSKEDIACATIPVASDKTISTEKTDTLFPVGDDCKSWNDDSSNLSDDEEPYIKEEDEGKRKEKIHYCPFTDCGYKSNRISNLKAHVRHHTGDRPFKCLYPGCSFGSSQSSNLRVHEKTHMGYRPWKCDYPGCVYAATEEKLLPSHKRKAHGIGTESSRSRRRRAKREAARRLAQSNSGIMSEELGSKIVAVPEVYESKDSTRSTKETIAI